jgi:putative ABC transport system substrate-binding protein
VAHAERPSDVGQRVARISASLRLLSLVRSAKPGDLPIDRATKFELVINLRTAKTLKLAIPATLLATADEVIE